MPRDENGNYTLPAGNPVVTKTTIDTSWANPTMADIANELTDSLSRTGEGGMLGPFLSVDGSVALPGLSWASQPNTGFYRLPSDMRVSVIGADVARWTGGKYQLWDGVTWNDVITEAPIDGLSYVRKDAGWEEFSGSAKDITGALFVGDDQWLSLGPATNFPGFNVVMNGTINYAKADDNLLSSVKVAYSNSDISYNASVVMTVPNNVIQSAIFSQIDLINIGGLDFLCLRINTNLVGAALDFSFNGYLNNINNANHVLAVVDANTSGINLPPGTSNIFSLEVNDTTSL